MMTDSDFEGLPVPTLQALMVEAFVPAEQIDPIMYSGSYYLIGIRPVPGRTRSCVTRSARLA